MAVTAEIGGVEGGGAMTWRIFYDDQTRNVSATGTDAGFCLVTVQLTNAITRTVAFYPINGGLAAVSANPDLASRMAAADFRLVADGSTTVLASNIPPAQVNRIIGKAGGVGGLVETSEWSRA